jgi:hypothetical protein
MEEKYPLKYKIKGNKKGGVCGIYVKNVKEDQLLSTIAKKIGHSIDQCVIIVLRIIRLPVLPG